MAAPMPTIMRTLTRRSAQAQLRPTQRCLGLRFYSSEEAPPPPPLLAKLKGDLKTAMRAKDAPRLAVLRSVLSATLNASKTGSPIKTDQQVVALLRKQAKTQKESVDEFRGAGREDLVEKEMAQIRVLEEYASASGMATVGEAEIRSALEAVKAELAAEGITGQKALGETMKRLFAAGGPLEGKDVEKGEVSKLAKEMLL
ncbi:Yqey-like protein-domain-containing protein [Coniochaeta sp. 2T2.1]|nr:Yqey-like protein-domain-containing protein [Coniochaeta sp. 2T2.1]